MLRYYFSQITACSTDQPQYQPTPPHPTFLRYPHQQLLYSPSSSLAPPSSSPSFPPIYATSSHPSSTHTTTAPLHSASQSTHLNDIPQPYQTPHETPHSQSPPSSSPSPPSPSPVTAQPSPYSPHSPPSPQTPSQPAVTQSPKQPQPPIQQVHPPWYFQLISGAVAGGMAAFVVSPLDVARIRIQIAPQDANVGPFGSHLIRSIVKEEGWLTLVSGLPTNMFALVPNWMSYFLAYSQFRSHVSPILVPTIGTTPFDILNALFAGGVSTFCTHPLWLVKARFQVQGLKKRFGTTNSAPQPTHLTGYVDSTSNHMYKGTFDALIKIARSEGFKGLYSGFLSQLLGLLHVGIHFPVYEALKRQLYILNCKKALKANNVNNPSWNPDELHDIKAPSVSINLLDASLPNHLTASQIVVASTISKIIACSLAYPHEILRSRFQTQEFLAHTNSKDKQREKYTSIIQALRSIIQTEGIKGLYRGLDVTLLRSVPACVVTFVMYEETMLLLRKYAPAGNNDRKQAMHQ